MRRFRITFTPMASGTNNFVWIGDLESVPPRTVLEECIAMKVSGRAEIRSNGHCARVDLLGGDVVGIEGVAPETLAEWTGGSFRVMQLLPDFDGNLRQERERDGSLAERDVSALLLWAEQHGLTIGIDLQDSG